MWEDYQDRVEDLQMRGKIATAAELLLSVPTVCFELCSKFTPLGRRWNKRVFGKSAATIGS